MHLTPFLSAASALLPHQPQQQQQQPMSLPTNKTLYFAYGSNLSLTQMTQRCPESTYIGVSLLQNYTWLIYARGYANVIPSSSPGHAVYALTYTLSPADEALLDGYEGVPNAYQKQTLDVEFWASADGERVDVTRPGVRSRQLVYINGGEEGRTEGTIKEEYVARMNRGIKDAVEKGVPRAYVRDVLRKWVREED